jgi:hypothetical protein
VAKLVVAKDLGEISPMGFQFNSDNCIGAGHQILQAFDNDPETFGWPGPRP